MATLFLRSACLLALLFSTSGSGGSPPSEAAPLVVPLEEHRALAPGVVKIVNASRYELIDLRLNSRQRLDNGATLPIGSQTEFSIEPGPVEYAFGAGFWSGLARSVWFGSAGRTLVAPGQTVTVTISNPSLEQVLTDFATSAEWVGVFFDAEGGLHTRQLLITSTGIFTLATDGAIEKTGLVELVAWPNAAKHVTFRLCDPDCGGEIRIAHPFKRFDLVNGPVEWPLIEYVRRE
jgi:hypothetical protein